MIYLDNTKINYRIHHKDILTIPLSIYSFKMYDLILKSYQIILKTKN